MVAGFSSDQWPDSLGIGDRSVPDHHVEDDRVRSFRVHDWHRAIADPLAGVRSHSSISSCRSIMAMKKR
jgi:hypothetical protein